MLYKVCYYFTILVVLFTPEAELRLSVARKRGADDKALFSDVIKNITRVNNVLEDLIKNYEKLKTLYKSEETMNDYTTDDEVDEVYKQKKRVRERAKGLVSSTTRNPNDLATQMFLSEEHANNDDGDDTNASDIEDNEKLNEKPKSQKPNNDKPTNNKFVIKIAKDKVLEKDRERLPQVEFVVQGGNSKSNTVKSSTTKMEPKTDQPAKQLIVKPFSAKQKAEKPKQQTNETVVIFKNLNEAVTRSKVPIDAGKMKLISRLRPEAEDENSQSRDSDRDDSTYVGLSGSLSEDSSEERQQNQDEGYNTSHQKSFENEKAKPNRNRQEKKVFPNNTPKKLYRPVNNTRTLKKVIKAEEFSYDRIWDEVLHKPVRLDTQKEIVYYKQPKIYFRNQITPETTWKYKEVTPETEMRSEEKPRTKAMKKKIQKQHSAQSLEDEKTIMKEQFKTRILRKAYGDACLKVVVKKCYKACKASTKSACKKYNCKTKFKTDFESKAKTNCIKEFRDVPPATTRTNDGPYDRQFQDITRNGYLAAACLPTAKLNKHEEKDKNTMSNTETQLNILRDRFEEACQKISSDKCTKACETSFDEACKLHDCSGGRLSAFTRACKKECKAAYKYGGSHSKKKHDKHSGSCESGSGSGSGSDSGSGSGSGSGSDSDTDIDLDEKNKTTTKQSTGIAVIKKIIISPKQRKNAPFQRAKLG